MKECINIKTGLSAPSIYHQLRIRGAEMPRELIAQHERAFMNTLHLWLNGYIDDYQRERIEKRIERDLRKTVIKHHGGQVWDITNEN